MRLHLLHRIQPSSKCASFFALPNVIISVLAAPCFGFRIQSIHHFYDVDFCIDKQQSCGSTRARFVWFLRYSTGRRALFARCHSHRCAGIFGAHVKARNPKKSEGGDKTGLDPSHFTALKSHHFERLAKSLLCGRSFSSNTKSQTRQIATFGLSQTTVPRLFPIWAILKSWPQDMLLFPTM